MTVALALSVVALVLSGIAIVSVAALRRDINVTRVSAMAGVGDQVDLAKFRGGGGTNGRLLMKADLRCVTCLPAVAQFMDEPVTDAGLEKVLVVQERSAALDKLRAERSDVAFADDADLFASIRTSWLPALVHIDAFGRVLDAVPAASPRAVSAFLEYRSANTRS